MFKKIISIVLVGLIFVPSLAFASEYVTENFEEALTEESIEHDLKDYKESEDKINIYLFRGHKCGFCNSFLTFLYNNVEEYGKYFNLVSYEIFNDANNSRLLDDVSKFMDGKSATGVPYIVIGDTAFGGFNESTDGDAIKAKIKELYESKDRYDVFEEMVKKPKDSTSTIIMWNAIFTVLAVGIVLYVNNRQIKVLNTKIDTLEKSLHKNK